MKIETLKLLPKHISNPVIIADSLTQKKSIVIITELTDSNNNPIYEELHNQEGKYVELEKINKRTKTVLVKMEELEYITINT